MNGSFKRALIDLNARGQKAFFKLINIFKNTPCDIEYSTYIVDHTVKKVILYASEILGIFDTRKCNKHSSENIFEQLFISVPIEKIDLSMCRYLLKVNRKTCKLSLYGELYILILLCLWLSTGLGCMMKNLRILYYSKPYLKILL